MPSVACCEDSRDQVYVDGKVVGRGQFIFLEGVVSGLAFSVSGRTVWAGILGRGYSRCKGTAA